MEQQSLCPGYTQVDDFSNNDDECSSTEEVEYVTLDLGNIEPTLVPSSSTYRLIGLDSPTPFLQLSGTILKGRHDDLLGSALLFTDDKETTERGKKSVAHVCTTSRRISFKEVHLRPKNNGDDAVPVPLPIVEESDLDSENDDSGLEYADPETDVVVGVGEEEEEEDPTLEYVDIAGPSTSTHTKVTGHRSISSSSSIPELPLAPVPQPEAEESFDPAMLIDRLTGVSRPSMRPPRASVSSVTGTTSGSLSKPKKRGKGKGKQKAVEESEQGGSEDKMDTTEG